MAGDWLKVEVNLPDKLEVWQIAGTTGLEPDAVVGKLIKVWRWFDAHTESGNASNVTYPLVDSVAGFNGFSDAMEDAGWLVRTGTTLSLPNFDRHNGKTAKNRALTAKRVAAHKSQTNGIGNAKVTQEPLPREEKCIKEKKAIAPRKRGKQPKVVMPAEFGISERVRTWATEKGHHSLEARLEHFRSKAKSNGYAYADWDEAFMGAIRDDWAKITAKPAPSAVQGKTKAEALAPSESPLEKRRAQIWQDFRYDQITATERDSRLAALENGA